MLLVSSFEIMHDKLYGDTYKFVELAQVTKFAEYSRTASYRSCLI